MPPNGETSTIFAWTCPTIRSGYGVSPSSTNRLICRQMAVMKMLRSGAKQ